MNDDEASHIFFGLSSTADNRNAIGDLNLREQDLQFEMEAIEVRMQSCNSHGDNGIHPF